MSATGLLKPELPIALFISFTLRKPARLNPLKCAKWEPSGIHILMSATGLLKPELPIALCINSFAMGNLGRY